MGGVSLRSPGGEGVVGRVVGQLRKARTVRVHNVDLAVVSGAVRGEGDAGAVLRPSWGPVVVAGDVRQARSFRAVGKGRVNDLFTFGRPAGPVAVDEPLLAGHICVHYPDRWVVAEEAGDIGDLLSVGRPGWHRLVLLRGVGQASLLGAVRVHEVYLPVAAVSVRDEGDALAVCVGRLGTRRVTRRDPVCPSVSS